ncbi:hypothetical protein LTS18_000636, partial [Coniosporium uncinatum]
STDLNKLKKEVYAMKVIRKSDMLRNSQEGHLRAERDFLVASENSRWVVPLISSFQDDTNLYLVMEYMVGGDFLGLLLREEVLDEPIAKWYVAEMILCVEEAHRMKWIHRDVKPDNFLITASGHLKISDFGLAFDGHWSHSQNYYSDHRWDLLCKFGIDVEGDEQDKEETQLRMNSCRVAQAAKEGLYGKHSNNRAKRTSGDGPILDRLNQSNKRRHAKSVVGTSQYMAPEVIRGENYDGRCDWWSIGIILYECLYGHTPFWSENRAATKEKILRHRQTLCFPHKERHARPYSENIRLPDVTHDAIDLIHRILQEKEQRLSSDKYRDNNDRPVRRINSRGAVRCTNYAGHFVFPDDCVEIKTHRFFDGIRWERMHLDTPPF